MDYEVRLLPMACLDEDEGCAEVFKMKSMRYSDDTVFWELRRVFERLLLARQEVDMKRLLARDFQPWLLQLTKLGFVPEDEVTPSRRAALAADPNNNDPKIRNLHTASTLSMLLLVVYFTADRRSNSDKERGLSFLVGWLQQMLAGSRMQELWEDSCEIPHEDCIMCGVAPVDGKCEHVRTLYVALDWQDRSKHLQFSHALVAM